MEPSVVPASVRGSTEAKQDGRTAFLTSAPVDSSGSSQDAWTNLAGRRVSRLSRSFCGKYLESLWVPSAALLGIIVGLLFTLADGGEGGLAASVSFILGWTYFFMWSISFYPQVVQNYYRRSVVGLSLEYQLLNMLGFFCYFMFNALLFWSTDVQDEYRARHGGHGSAVRLNDVVFAGHAFLITGGTVLQIFMYYDHPPLDGQDKLLRYGVVAALAVIIAGFTVLALVVASTGEQAVNWLTYLALMSYVKVVISVAKYCPQVWINYRLRSTEGWSINGVLMDFSGGLLSVLQLLLDAHRKNDWSAVTGDPAKLLLGNISMFFDVVFMVQHFCLYRAPHRS